MTKPFGFARFRMTSAGIFFASASILLNAQLPPPSGQVSATVGLPTVSIVALVPQASEPGSGAPAKPGIFKIHRSGDTLNPLTVFLVYEGSATVGVDYEALPQLITIPAGSSEAQLIVRPLADSVTEGIESVTATLVNPADRLPSYQPDLKESSAKITILDTPSVPLIRVFAADPAATELPLISSAIDPARFTISRDANFDHDLVVSFSLHGTARPGADYRIPGPSIRIPAGQREASVEIDPISDEIAEPMETVSIQLEPAPISELDSVPPPIYQIDPGFPAAAAVIYDGKPPPSGALELALPGDGDTYSGTESILLLAAAYHPTLVVSKVDFYSNGQLIGSSQVLTDPSQPPAGLIFHRLGWNPVAGDHVLSARAQLASGLELVSSKIVVHVGAIQPPSVTILRPLSGAVFKEGDPVEVAAEARPGTAGTLAVFVDAHLLERARVPYVVTKWASATTGTHLISAQWLGDDGAVGNSVPVKIFVRALEEIPVVQRHLPGGYIPGEPLQVELAIETPVTLLAVEDQPPAGWNVTTVSEDGAFDWTTGRVKFGLFFDQVPKVLQYTVIPPLDTKGPQTFTGVSSSTGKLLPITGDQVLERVNELHPADLNPPRFSISVSELTAYAAAWKQGVSWPEGPNPIPLDYVTQAAALWRAGETYFFDPSAGVAPLCWVSASARPKTLELGTTSATAVRSFSSDSTAPHRWLVKIAVRPASQSSGYVVEEQLPIGWSAETQSDGGFYDPIRNRIGWGIFTDGQARALSYYTTPARSAANLGSWRGWASFDGSSTPIGGATKPAVLADRAILKLRWLRPGHGRVHLSLEGARDVFGWVERSTDLKIWSTLAPLYFPDGAGELDADILPPPSCFYRLRLP